MNLSKFLLAAGVTSYLATPCLAAGVSAGTLIESTASASYDTGAGRNTVDSNKVTLRIDEVIDATLSALDSGTVPLAGATATLAFSLTNTGNGPEAFRISSSPVAGSAFDPVINTVAIDSNNNGIYDSGIDQIVAAGAATPDVAAGASMTVFVLVAPSGTPKDGDQGRINIRAEAVSGTGSPGTVLPGQGTGGTDAVIGSSGGSAQITSLLVIRSATVQIVKSYTISDPFGGSEPVPGAFVTFTLNTQVAGSGSVSNLVVTDPIPAGSRYVPGSLTLESAPLTDAADTDNGRASSTGIEVRLGDLPGGSQRAITFRIQID